MTRTNRLIRDRQCIGCKVNWRHAYSLAGPCVITVPSDKILRGEKEEETLRLELSLYQNYLRSKQQSK